MENSIERSNFTNRLNALQRLCSDTDNNFPKALLFVPGQDGRYNKGSVTLLKYLFRGCVAKELFDETLDSLHEPLEDIVILIKRSSVSIILSNEMKKLLAPLYSSIPFLVEYISSETEEKEIDSMQARKCCDFKRMLLESLKDGDGVGIPVPIGYDDIQDIESWPLLQSFAMDQVYCATGFFTARYNVADVTEHLDILFKTVDGYYLDSAINALQKTIRPHMMQAISMLDASTADQRRRVTGEEAVGPLEVLYEFGELDVSGPLDPSTRPIVLFGAETAHFAMENGQYGSHWRNAIASSGLHTVYEACEPRTGLRWCRTYFLCRGRSVGLINEGDVVVRGGEEEGDQSEEEDRSDATSNHDQHYSHHHVAENAEVLRRLESFYVKLWMALRSVVRSAFAHHTDVLEAGTYVQQRMDALLTGTSTGRDAFSSPDDDLRLLLPDLTLLASERLQVHMDCMNATGEIVAIEDVDDMGGACWTYIRVSVHGIALGGGAVGTVAVGDTFLFSCNSTVSTVDISYSIDTSPASQLRLPLVQDGFCVTHSLPYYRCLLGGGLEDRAAQRLIACSRSPTKLSLLGLGRPLVYAGSGTLSLPLLTDHWVVPLVQNAELRVFSEGFLVERMDGVSSTPLLVSIGMHVERVWVVDSTECFQQAARLLPSDKVLSALPSTEVPAGLLVVFRLKTFSDEDGASSLDTFQYNPLERVMPLVGTDLSTDRSTPKETAHHVAIFVRAGCRAAVAMNTASAAWRVACRVHDVQEHRGADVALPEGILRAFVTAVDVWSASPEGDDGDSDLDVLEVSAEALVSTAEYVTQNPSLVAPGTGLLSMRCVHAMSEAKRLTPCEQNVTEVLRSATDSLTSKHVQSAKRDLNKRQLLVLAGHAGSGVSVVGSYLQAQLAETRSSSVSTLGPVQAIHLDLSSFDVSGDEDDSSLSVRFVEFLDQAITKLDDSSSSSSSTVLVSITLTAVFLCRMPELLELLSVRLTARVSGVLSVISPAALHFGVDSNDGYADQLLLQSHHGVGQEIWRASTLQLLEPTFCDFVVAVDGARGGSSGDGSAAYSALRSYLSNVNPSATIIRLSPANLRLDADSVEQLLRSLSVGSPASLSRASSRAVVGYAPDYLALLAFRQQTCGNLVHITRSHVPSLVGVGLVSFRVEPPVGNEWNLGNIVKTLQLLVPHAQLFSTAIEDTWAAPPSTKVASGSLSRLLALARAKVLMVRQCEEARRFFDSNVKELLLKNADQFVGVVKSFRSAHGSVRTRSGLVIGGGGGGGEQGITSLRRQHQSSVVVEACSGFVVLRPSVHQSSVPSQQSALVVEGVFSQSDVAFLTQLFGLCYQRSLPRKALISASELTFDDKLRIQSLRKYCSRPLPGDAWFDGHSYIDINGTRSALRPDIGVLASEYVVDENKRTEQYNTQLVGF